MLMVGEDVDRVGEPHLPAEFAYTIGLWHSFRRPEVVMFGLEGGGMGHWLNACVDRGRDHGWPAEGEEFAGVLDGFAVQLRPVHVSWHDALFGAAWRFYRGVTVPVLQLVWPDSNGVWPWQEGATATSRTTIRTTARDRTPWRLMQALCTGCNRSKGKRSARSYYHCCGGINSTANQIKGLGKAFTKRPVTNGTVQEPAIHLSRTSLYSHCSSYPGAWWSSRTVYGLLA